MERNKYDVSIFDILKGIIVTVLAQVVTIALPAFSSTLEDLSFKMAVFCALLAIVFFLMPVSDGKRTSFTVSFFVSEAVAHVPALTIAESLYGTDYGGIAVGVTLTLLLMFYVILLFVCITIYVVRSIIRCIKAGKGDEG